MFITIMGNRAWVQLRIILILNRDYMNADQELDHMLRHCGYHLTRQRLLVLDILKEHPGHLDAGMIFQEAKKRDDRISLATVYRSLALLKEAGLVEENRLGEDHGHFETIQGSQHYHFACISCGKVIEFETRELAEVVKGISKLSGIQVKEIHFDLRGYCADCQKDQTQSKIRGK
jgi:Fur family transcriptional regulator, ferric uptake regulator